MNTREEFIKDASASLDGVLKDDMTQAEKQFAERSIEMGDMQWAETENGRMLEWVR